MSPANILVVDDDADFRHLVIALLGIDRDLRVCGEASDGAAALEMVRREPPRVVLMDLMMPHIDGLEATRRIKRMAPGTKVAVLSSATDERYRRLAYESGADLFLNKRDTGAALLPAIRALIDRPL